MEIPSNLSCAYLKGHLLGKSQDWYQIFGPTLVQNTATDFAQLKAALSNTFPAIRNKKDLEIKFYVSLQRRQQERTDFIYDLLKLHKQLELRMSEEALVDHIFGGKIFMQGYTGSNYENSRQGNQRFYSRNRFQRDYRRLSDGVYQFRNRGQNDDFSRGDRRNRGSRENFSRGDRRQRGKLNVLKVRVDEKNQTTEVPITLPVICMSPVELPCVPILLNDTFTKALWDTGAENKWAEIIPLKKASARVISDTFFDNYISHFGARIKLISDNGPQFISDIFEHLSDRLGIRHVKTVVYRPQESRTERVNHDLVHKIANYVNDQHDTWDQFLRESAYANHTAVNEATGKSPAELFLGRKLITAFQKLVMVSNGTEFAVGDIERLFDEGRRNTKAKREKWAKYYDRRWRDVEIKMNDWVLIATHTLSSATRKVVAKFKPKFEGPYSYMEIGKKVNGQCRSS
ncbi:retrovirus-related Pol polyprotein from transposon 297 [Trichonephila clavipes]|nr:retrovirus-related Pol polyprotein from transposon 297 [Trichonephila clavipes]